MVSTSLFSSFFLLRLLAWPCFGWSHIILYHKDCRELQVSSYHRGREDMIGFNDDRMRVSLLLYVYVLAINGYEDFVSSCP
jgi:hypothetical protein